MARRSMSCTEDESEIEQVFGQYVMESLLDEIGELSEEEATWPCGENHRAGEFCYLRPK